MVSHKQDNIISLIESLNNGPENNMLIYYKDIPNYLGVNIKKTSDVTFKLSKYHMVKKIINYVGVEVSVIIKAIEMLSINLLLYK